MSDELLINDLLNNPNYQVLRRLKEDYPSKNVSVNEKLFNAAIIDLETLGGSALLHEIIEIGLLKFTFSQKSQIISVSDTYNELQDPLKAIPEKISKLTGITDDDVKGKSINWKRVEELILDCDLIICHNSNFDRKFLEIQTPNHIKAIFEKKAFACTVQDIDWSERGFESKKLDYLNWKLGFFYEAHRALTDCWATFNLLINEEGAFEELKNNTKIKEIAICAINAPYQYKEVLKNRGYRWSDGSHILPKSWWITLSVEKMAIEEDFLNKEIYHSIEAFKNLPKYSINAFNRYSSRL